MTVATQVRGEILAREPRILCLGGALVIALATFIMPVLGFQYGGIQGFWYLYGGLEGFTLLLILVGLGLVLAAMNRPDETLDRCMALTGTALASVTVGLCLTRGASFETFVAFVGAMACLTGGLFVVFPSLLERAAAAYRTNNGPAPGWYDDPADSSGVRWWDGRRWAPTVQSVEPSNEVPELDSQWARSDAEKWRVDVQR